VVAIDVDRRKISDLRAGRSYVEDVPDDALQAVLGRIEATARPAALARCDAVLICVPTPLTANREPDLGPLVSAARTLSGVLQARSARRARIDDLPRRERERLAPVLAESGLVAGEDFNLAFSPARVDRGPHRLHPVHDAEGRRRAHPPPAATAPRPSTARSATRSCASPRPRRPS